MKRKNVLGALAATLGVLLISTSAHAVLIFNGVTYTLQEATTGSSLTNEFTLTITGINGPADTEGGRSGVNAFALTPPNNFVSATMITPPTGFTLTGTGLNSGGCDISNANFFCFDNSTIDDANSATFGPVLAANSSLTFVFDVTISSGTFAGYTAPSFKIDWVGFKPNGDPRNNYDLVSMEDTITPGGSTGGQGGEVPEPGSLVLLGSALAGLGLLSRRRRKA